jgi:hypothetical protein
MKKKAHLTDEGLKEIKKINALRAQEWIP